MIVQLLQSKFPGKFYLIFVSEGKERREQQKRKRNIFLEGTQK
jgi:hypothetical protein